MHKIAKMRGLIHVLKNSEILKFNPTPISPMQIIYSDVLAKKLLKPDGIGVNVPRRIATTKRIKNKGTMLKNLFDSFDSCRGLFLMKDRIVIIKTIGIIKRALKELIEFKISVDEDVTPLIIPLTAETSPKVELAKSGIRVLSLIKFFKKSGKIKTARIFTTITDETECEASSSFDFKVLLTAAIDVTPKIDVPKEVRIAVFISTFNIFERRNDIKIATAIETKINKYAFELIEKAAEKLADSPKKINE